MRALRRRVSGILRNDTPENVGPENVDPENVGPEPVPEPHPGPVVSVVLPIYNVERWLDECLDSLSAQTFTDYELLVVDDGSPDGSRAIAEKRAAADERIRIVTRPNGGLGAARNTGIREARGEFLTFVDSDDALPETALADLVEAARADDADLVAGSVERFDGTDTWLPDWVDTVHSQRLGPIRVTDHLSIVRNLYTWNKLFRRTFWDRCGLWFREGVAYEDQPIITQLFAAAERLSVIPEVVYRYRVRPDQSSISQQVGTMADLDDRIAAWEATRHALADGPQEVYRAWLLTLMGTHFHWYFGALDQVGDDYWSALRQSVLSFLDDADADLWWAVPPQRRVLLELVRQGRREEAAAFVAEGGRNLQRWPARRTPDGLTVDLPGRADLGLAEELYLLRPEQVRVAHRVEGLRWTADGCEVTGWAYLEKIDPRGQEVRVVLRHRDGREVEVRAKDRPETAFGEPYEDALVDYAGGTFRATVPIGELVATAGSGAVWTLFVRVTNQGLEAQVPVTQVLRNGSAGTIPARAAGGGRLVEVDTRRHHPVTIRVTTARIEVADLRRQGRTLHGRLGGVAAERFRSVVLAGADRTVEADVEADRSFALDVPAGEATWALRAIRRDGADRKLPLADPDWRDVPAGPAGEPALRRTRRNTIAVTTSEAGAVAEEVVVVGDELVVRGRAWVPGLSRVCVVVGGLASPGSEVRDGRFEERHPLGRVAPSGFLAIPSGTHDATVRLDDREVPLVATDVAVAAMPAGFATTTVEGRVLLGPGGAVRLHLLRPVGNARSRYAQAVLRAAPVAPLVDGLLLRSDEGRTAGGDPAAVHEAVRAAAPDLPVWWGVNDHSIEIPSGAERVIVNSARWHELLGSAGCYVDDAMLPPHHRKVDGQVVVRTSVRTSDEGRTAWTAEGLAPGRLESLVASVAAWDAVLAPGVDQDWLRRELGFTGPVLAGPEQVVDLLVRSRRR